MKLKLGLKLSKFSDSLLSIVGLETRHIKLIDNNWNDVIENLNASLVGFPSPTLNGTDQYGSFFNTIFTANQTLYFRCKLSDFVNSGIIGRGSSAFSFIRFETMASMRIESDTNGDEDTFNYTALNTDTIYDFVITQNDSNLWTLYIDNVSVDTMTLTNTNVTYNIIGRSKFGDYFDGTFFKFIHYDRLFNLTEIGNEDYKSPGNYTTVLHYEFVDRYNSAISIDLSSNLNHLTWNGTTGVYMYDPDGNNYGLNTGVQIFNTSVDESGTKLVVPYKPDGMVLYDIALEASQDILGTTYYLISNNPSVNNGYNICPALFDFDPNNTTNSKLDNFDGSNVTIYSNDRRNLPEYNASESYRIDGEYLPYDILNSLFNANYTEKVFTKVLTNLNNKVVGIQEILNYSTQQTGSNLQKILTYCNLLSIVAVIYYIFLSTVINNSSIVENSSKIIL